MDFFFSLHFSSSYGSKMMAAVEDIFTFWAKIQKLYHYACDERALEEDSKLTGLSFGLVPVRLNPNHNSGQPPSPSTPLITTMFGRCAPEVR